MITTTEYSVDFNHHNFSDIFLFHRNEPAAINNTDQTSHGSNKNISFSPAPKLKIPSEIKYKKIGVNNSGVNKIIIFFKNTKSEPPFSYNIRGNKFL